METVSRYAAGGWVIAADPRILIGHLTALTAEAACVDAGRSEWRATQLRIAIPDDMKFAAELLHEHGYVVGDRQSEASTRRHERFTAY